MHKKLPLCPGVSPGVLDPYHEILTETEHDRKVVSHLFSCVASVSLLYLTGELRSSLVREYTQDSPESGGVLTVVLVCPVKKQVLLPP